MSVFGCPLAGILLTAVAALTFGLVQRISPTWVGPGKRALPTWVGPGKQVLLRTGR